MFRDTIPHSGTKMPRLCLGLPTPVEIIVALVMTYVFNEVPLLCCVARIGVSIPIQSRTPAMVAPFIQRALQGRMFGIDLATDAADFWGPLAPVQQGNML